MKALTLQPPHHWGPFRKALNLVLAVTLTLGAVTLPEAWAADYYVNSTTGSDANGGSSAAPWKTLTHALDTGTSGVTSGDVIHVAAGTYDAGNGETFPLALADGVAIIGDTTTPSNCVISAPAGENAFYNDDSTSPAGLSSATRLAGCTLEHDGSTDSGLMRFDVGSQSMAPQIDHDAFAGTSQHDDGIVYYDVSGASGTFRPTIDNNTFTDVDEAVILKALGPGTNQVFSPTITNNTFTSCNYPVNYTMETSAEGTVGGLVQGNTFRATVDNDIYVDFAPRDDGYGLVFNPTITVNDMQSGAATNVYAGPSGYYYSGDATFSPKITDNTMDGTSENVNIYGGYYYIDGDYTVSPTISGNTMTGASLYAVELELSTLSVSTANERNVFSPTITNNSITGNNAYTGISVSLSASYGGHGQLEGTTTISGNSMTGVRTGVNWEMSNQYSINAIDLSTSISNNTFTSPTDAGISLNMDGMNFSGTGTFKLTVEGNEITGSTGYGMAMEPAWGLADANQTKVTELIRGNTVTGSTNDGIWLYLGSQSSNSLDAQITDNVLQGNTGSGLYMRSADLGYNGFQVSCNTITGNTGNGVIEAVSAAYMDPPADYGGGNLSSPGNNEIHGNGNGSTTFDFNNQRGQGSGLVQASAQHNWWGSGSAPTASQISGPVDASSFLTAAPTVNLSSNLTATVANDVDPSGPSVGDTLLYTAVIDSNGTCGDASATFTATVDSNTTVVPGSVTTTQGIVQSENPPTVALGHLGAGDSATVTWKVMVNGGTSVESQGTVTATRSGSTLTDDPATSTANDPTVTAFQQQPEGLAIPTLGSWALLALAALLLLLGVLLLRRRRLATAALVVLLAFGAGWARAESTRGRVSVDASTVKSASLSGKNVTLTLADGMRVTVAKAQLRVRDMRNRHERPGLSSSSAADRVTTRAALKASRQAARPAWRARVEAMTPAQREQMRERRKAAMVTLRRDPTALLKAGTPVVVRIVRAQDGRIQHARVNVVASEARARAEAARVETRRTAHVRP